MNTPKLLLATVLSLCTVAYAQAQVTADDMVKEWERAKAYTKEYLDAMPEEGYALKPTPEMRSFAEQMLHLADAHYAFGSTASGLKSPVALGSLEKGTDKSKATVTKQVLDSYDFMISSIKAMTPAQYAEKATLFGRFEMTKGVMIAKAFEHQTHHRGQTTVYLRLAKVAPPQEKLF